MHDAIVAHIGGSNENTSGKADIAIAVISYRLRSTLDEIFRAVRAKPEYRIYLVCTAGPAIQTLSIPGVTVLTTPYPMQIGEARVFAAESIAAHYLAFLDDDCIPERSWLDSLAACIAENPGAAMFFGPRREVSSSSSAGLVRTLEAKRSRKRLLHCQKRNRTAVLVTPEGPTCAGGNMVINRNRVPASELFDPVFAGCGFEDVDMQLRLLEAGLPIYFVPRLGVRHHDPLSVRQLLGKSIKSGRGISQAERKHGDRFRRISRWSNRAALVRVFARCWIWLPAALVSMPLALLVVTALAEAAGAYRLNRNPRSVIAWFTIKPMRDLCILASAILTDLRAIRQESYNVDLSNG